MANMLVIVVKKCTSSQPRESCLKSSPFPQKKKHSKHEQPRFDEKFSNKVKTVKYSEGKSKRVQNWDYQIRMRLLPYLLDISKQRKQYVRTKLMGVIMQKPTAGVTATHCWLFPSPSHSCDSSHICLRNSSYEKHVAVF